jgi:hypothetical protein
MDLPLSRTASMGQNGCAALWATIHPEEASRMARQMSVLSIDIAKLVFHIVGMDHTGHVVLWNVPPGVSY